VLDVTPQRVQMDYYVTGDRRDPDAGSSWSASWATTADSNTVHAVASPVGRG
jgi:alkaline phosphatase D